MRFIESRTRPVARDVAFESEVGARVQAFAVLENGQGFRGRFDFVDHCIGRAQIDEDLTRIARRAS